MHEIKSEEKVHVWYTKKFQPNRMKGLEVFDIWKPQNLIFSNFSQCAISVNKGISILGLVR